MDNACHSTDTEHELTGGASPIATPQGFVRRKVVTVGRVALFSHSFAPTGTL